MQFMSFYLLNLLVERNETAAPMPWSADPRRQRTPPDARALPFPLGGSAHEFTVNSTYDILLDQSA